MSYILEALRKSQQERELGHVPTLQTPAFPAGEEGPRPSFGIPLAVVLAALAVVIALYSVLRSAPPTPEPVAEATRGPQAATPENTEEAQIAPKRPPAGSDTPQPVPETSSPQRSANASLEVPAKLEPAPAASKIATRQQPQATPAHQSRTRVPPDLIADIEAFKRQVSEKQSNTTDAAKKGKEVTPQDLRLPKQVRSRLPEFIMSAHIYDADPAKRFVLINGLKTREGEESREEITVEQILPDGAVLSFDGNKFFQRR